MIFVRFDRADVFFACNACTRRVGGFFLTQELAEYAFEQTVKVEIGHGNLCRFAEYAAEVDVYCVFDEVNAEQRLCGRHTCRLLVEFEAEFDFVRFNVDIRNEVEREERALVVAEFVDDVEFERRSADCGIDEPDYHIENFAQIDFVGFARLIAASVQGNLNRHFKMCRYVLQLHIVGV